MSTVLIRKVSLLLAFAVLFFGGIRAQKFSKTLLKADKLYIKKSYRNAVGYYEKYLAKHPRDFYASRQAALCYGRLNNPSMAIDYWPAVIENGEASELDNLEYARCLLANYRIDDARKVFIQMSRSTNKPVSEWGRAYLNTFQFFKDSAFCRVTEVNGVNTPGHEYAPVILNERLYFISDPLKNIRVFTALTDERLVNISSAMKSDSLNFYSMVTFQEFQARNVNGLFCFSGDGSMLYLSTAVYSKDLGIKKKDPFYKFQLYTTPVNSHGEMQPFKHNQPGYDFMHPCLSKDGRKLYFASDMKGSLGGKDIFVCEQINGEWGAPVNLGPEINTPGNEVFPFVTEDGVLYFASDFRPGLGGLDIFSANAGTGGKLFEKAQNAGSPINGQFDDFGIYLLPGGKSGYLSSNRKNNTDDDIFFFKKSKP